ncbi:PAS/PAC sensor hybrid histidine kinase [Alkalidesulfovibrio alkalitolerans DSM 16529]|uniref:histidine kinase n=1 Tax=Alkalidesulfovibrio alkalitolerans DSM 16529 TaxID=1121439 RepID=S7T6W5_9BACT|nr:ATP-binding protein [Alkalidesulfovibrio alkalitolerans]EPR32296.1 PAS/PAC sensor hybrid histidine kinase [Alkalidesulfovibrio alkalitolerans DSM 16529]
MASVRFFRFCLALALAWAAMWAVPSVARESAVQGPDAPKHQVLFLNSYHNGYSWSDDILAGARRTLRDSTYAIDLQLEYVDAKKHPGRENMALLARLMASKFAQTRFEVVIVSDNDAYDFMREYGTKLFPGVPTVFCGVNDFKPEEIVGLPMTGLVENPDIEANLRLAALLHPDRRRMVVIADESVTSRAIVAQFRQAAPRFAARFDYEYHNVESPAELVALAQATGDNDVVFYVPIYLEEEGYTYSAEEVLRMLSTHTNAPIYSGWEFLLGHGMVGGKLLSGERHGAAAAYMALDILDGAKVHDIPVEHAPQDENVFDWPVVKRFLIPMSSLPEGSRFINQPAPFYELQKPIFWTIIASLVIMSAILVQLILTNAKRRRAEEQVKEQLNFMQLLLDTIPQLVYWKDAKGRYMGANKSFADFFGLGDPRKVIGLTNHDLMHIDDHARRGDDADQEVLVSGTGMTRMIWELSRPDGQAATLDITKVPLSDHKGQVVGVLSTAEDITSKVSLERQLLQSQKMEALGTFVSGIAHDFNNILTTVINSAELALLDLPKDAEAFQDIQRALRAAQRGSRLVMQMHTYSRPSREGFKAVDIALAVREALGLLRVSLPGNIKVVERIEPGPSTTMANPTQINQVVMNLCTNAFQAMRETGGVLTVGLSRRAIDTPPPGAPDLAPGTYLLLAVEDTGPGIPEVIRDKIFDPFFTTKDKGEGTGLGLAVVQGIAKAHKGRVVLAPAQGAGARFELWLPCSECAPAAEVDQVSAPREGSERILFVEDNPDQLVAVPRALSRLGYQVTPARGALEALDALASGERFDAVVTDYDMPEVDGVEFARSLAQIAPGLPVVMVSGRRGAIEAAQRAPGIGRVLMKPYSVGELSRALGDMLDDFSNGR